MEPTNKLRWLVGYDDEFTNNSEGPFVPHERKYKSCVLQQWWAPVRAGQSCPDGEWRDIPTEHIQ